MKLTFAVILIGYFALHSLLADERVKQFLQERIVSPKYYRIFYNLMAIGLLIPILGFYFRLPSTLLFQAPIWLTSASYIMIIIGFLLLLLAIRQYNLSEFSGADAFQKTKAIPVLQLQKKGFNSMVRHPLYFAMLVIFWSIFFANPTDKLMSLALIITLYIFIGIKLEERKLVKVFGKEYQSYQNDVPMLLPHFFQSLKRLIPQKEINKNE